MAISMGDEFETSECFKCNIEEIPTYSVKLLIRKLVTIWISGNFFSFTLNTFISLNSSLTEITMMFCMQSCE